MSALTDPGADGTWAAAVMRQGNSVAPQLVVVEATNTLRKLEMRGEVTSAHTRTASRELTRVAVSLVPFAPFASRVWELRRNLTAYDAWYVAVAEAFELPLATLDRRLAAAPGSRCDFLTP